MTNVVSVIICTHNRKQLVPRAINSALMQVDCDIEVVVVDDCSDDGTFEYLKKRYGGRITLISTDINSGRAVGSNRAVKYSSGEYIALLDDDDYWIDDRKLKKQINAMQSNPALGVLGTWWVELKPNDLKEKIKPLPPRNRYFLIDKLLRGGGIVSGSSPVISREAWEKVKGMDTLQLKGIDSDLYRRIALAGYGVDVLPEITTIADAAHGLDRMTPVRTREQVKKALSAHWHILKKYYRSYLCHPVALSVRLRNMSKLAVEYIIRE